MDQVNCIEKLNLFGLTRQEAAIYVCLIQNTELTGYEVAKLTGISRSNVYSTLAGLTEKGAAYLMEGTTSKYRAVSIKEFCDNKMRNMKEVANYLIDQIPDMTESSDGYITISSYKNILDKIHHMILSADKRLYVSAPEKIIKVIAPELRDICKRGIKVVIVTNKLPDIKGIQVHLIEKEGNQIRLITDSKYVLTGEITGSNLDTCLYSGQKNFVTVFKEALSNEIKLIALTKGEVKNEQDTICDKGTN